MSTKLMELKTEELLEKFGAGNHKPGSGSAAAEYGLISAHLLRTVIDLTDKPKRQHIYAGQLPELRRIPIEIDNRLIPSLKEFFQTDSDQFDKAIKLRQARDKEKDISVKIHLVKQATVELKPATAIPIQVARLCVELAEFAEYVFANGFQSARGDAGVAQHGALAAVGVCLQIIYLNLLSFDDEIWINETMDELESLQEKYDALLATAPKCVDILKKEVERHYALKSEMRALFNEFPYERYLSDETIENAARNLQRLLWKHRTTIWKSDDISSPLDVLQPDTSLKVLGYQFYRPNLLDRHEVNGELYEVAGVIDNENKVVQVSKAYDLETQNFTAAHELAHAIFHKEAVLHRDRPVDGSLSIGSIDRKESQANKFAACFLMPRREVIKEFKELFSMDKFAPTENKVFALTRQSLKSFRKRFETKRDVSRLLAGPLPKIFQVSIGAMAIRLEELELVEY